MFKDVFSFLYKLDSEVHITPFQKRNTKSFDQSLFKGGNLRALGHLSRFRKRFKCLFFSHVFYVVQVAKQRPEGSEYAINHPPKKKCHMLQIPCIKCII